ncbi:gamma-glutamylcyclotransferase family protein [Sedimenticola sp.]|uniref:gamma-glutamylcyclotransferase family protein n=1 Tax=Sedimenticola sp. TaxID=1940285 RepID=UPI003D0CA89A
MYYFAYGSNLSSRRLRQRLSSARPVSMARLQNHKLCWHKQGRDGSGKCDAAHTGDASHEVIGVVYSMAAQERPLLDRYEGVGVGYEAVEIRPVLDTGKYVQAFTYRATLIDASAMPFRWYKIHVLQGAYEHNLPSEYIAQLEAVPTLEDPDRERHQRELLVYGDEILR